MSGSRCVRVAVVGLVAVLGASPAAVAAARRPGAILRAGQRLRANGSRTSANHRYRLTMQRDGNLVLRRVNGGRALWSSQTGGHRGAVAVMQRDGNLVVYSRTHRALFATGVLVRGSRVVVQRDGNVVELDRSHKVLWSSRSDAFTLGPGQPLRAGTIRRSPDGRFQLNMQRDGNLVLYALPSERALWSSQTGGDRGAFAQMQADGNLVVYSAARLPLYSTATGGHLGARLVVQDDGNAVIYDPSGQPLWSSQQDGIQLTAGQTLDAGQSRTSPNGAYRLAMQTDGNLVLYDLATGRALWSAGTGGHPGALSTLQGDGNLVVYSPAHQPLFATGTRGDARTRAVVQDDGSLVVYTGGGTALWSSRTGLVSAAP